MQIGRFALLLVGMISLCGNQGCFLAPDKIEPPPLRLPPRGPKWDKTVTLSNPGPLQRKRALVMIPVSSLCDDDVDTDRLEVTHDGLPIPSQVVQLPSDDGPSEPALAFQLDFAPGKRETATVRELQAEQTSGRFPTGARAKYEFGHEGYAVVESSRAGYGIYSRYPVQPLPGALQLSFFGKPAPGDDALRPPLVLDENRKDGDAMDLLRVGASMGLGGPVIAETRPMHDRNASISHRVVNAGPLAATVAVDVQGWKTAEGEYDATLRYTMYAGHEYVQLDVDVRPIRPAGERFGVGMVKLDREDAFHYDVGRRYLCQWGQQERVTSPVGLAIVAPDEKVASIKVLSHNGSRNRVAYFEPDLDEQRPYRYRIFLLATWPGAGTRTAERFSQRVERLAAEMARPIQVEL